MSIQIRPFKASDVENCAALYKEIYNTTYQGVVDSRLITSINQEDTVQRIRGQWLAPGGMFFVAEEIAGDDAEEAGKVNPCDSGEETAGSGTTKGTDAEEIIGGTDAKDATFMGYVRGIPSPDVLGAFWLEGLFLTQAARGKGLGRELIHHMGRQAVNQGYNQMVIDVFAGNDHAEQVYRHLGAELIDDNYIEEINLFPVRAKLLLWDNMDIFTEK